MLPRAGFLARACLAFSTFSFTALAQVQIDTIEINQGIGVQKGDARKFVAGRDAVIRAILSSPITVDNDQTSATITRGGQAVTTLTPNTYEGPTSIVDFLCPSRDACGNWAAGSYAFEVRVNGVTRSTEGAYDFVERGQIRILALPVKANFGGTVVEVTDSRWKTFADYVRAVYPVASDGLIWATREELDASDSKFDLETEDGRRNLWEALERLIPAECANTPNADGCYTQVFGFIMDRPMGYPNGRLQGYTYGKPANIGVVKDEDAAATVAHEIGHTYGLGDTYDGGSFACAVNPAPDSFQGKDFDDPSKNVRCTAGREPLGEVSGTKVPEDHHPYEVGGRGALPASAEYMGSDGQQGQFWTSQDAYDWLFDKLAPQTTASGQDHGAPQTEQRFIQCFGSMRRNATSAADVQMDPCWSYLDYDSLPTTTGPYMLAAVNAAGTRLASDSFSPTFDPVGSKGLPSQPVEFAAFSSELLFPPETVKLQILRDGIVLREIPISANAPVISNVAPQATGTVNGTVTITWDATDADGDRLTYELLYNPDVGDPESEWYVVMSDLTESRFTLEFGEMPGGPRAKFGVIATDGINAAEAESAEFIVAAKPPEVFVEELPHGGVFPLGKEIVFDGDAYDLQDDDIPESRLVWSSNISGILGTGTPIKVSNLPQGRHIITLTATNSDGLRGSDSVNVTVTATPRRRTVGR